MTAEELQYKIAFSWIQTNLCSSAKIKQGEHGKLYSQFTQRAQLMASQKTQLLAAAAAVV